jgi:hypothetical protein
MTKKQKLKHKKKVKKAKRHDSEKKEAAPRDGFDASTAAMQAGSTKAIGLTEQRALRENAAGLMVALEQHDEISKPLRDALVNSLVLPRLDATLSSLDAVGTRTPLTDSRNPEFVLLFRDLLAVDNGDSESELRVLRGMLAAVLVGQAQTSAEQLRIMEVNTVLAAAVMSNQQKLEMLLQRETSSRAAIHDVQTFPRILYDVMKRVLAELSLVSPHAFFSKGEIVPWMLTKMLPQEASDFPEPDTLMKPPQSHTHKLVSAIAHDAFSNHFKRCALRLVDSVLKTPGLGPAKDNNQWSKSQAVYFNSAEAGLLRDELLLRVEGSTEAGELGGESDWIPEEEALALAEKTLLAWLLCSALLYLKECGVTLKDSGKLDDVIRRLEGDGEEDDGDDDDDDDDVEDDEDDDEDDGAAAQLDEIKLLAKANGVKLDLVVSLWYTVLYMCGGLGMDVKQRSVREDPAHRHVLVQLKLALLEMDAWRKGEDEAEIDSLLEAARSESQTLADTLTTGRKSPITLQLKMEPEIKDDDDDNHRG